MKQELSTRLELKNGARHPAVHIKWKWDESWCGGGWTGDLSIWHSPGIQDARHHTVGVGQPCPLGTVSVMFDPHSHGAWESATIDGTGITERDLQWATCWAVLALKSRRRMGDLPPLPS